MINRINLILQAKNITAKQFAEEIGIQPSGMSHIMSGRNNPSLEFVNKVIRRYPEIDANWLLLGKGQMYASGVTESPAISEPTLFAPPSPSPAPVYTPAPDPIPEPEPISEMDLAHEPTEIDREQEKKEPAPIMTDERRLVKILFFYDDRTFVEYRPE